MQKPENSAKKDQVVGVESNCSSKTVVPRNRPEIEADIPSSVAAIQYAAHANIMKAKHRATDDVIENLHRTLKEQTLTKAIGGVSQAAGSALSGARSSRVGRTPYVSHKQQTKNVRKVKRSARAQISHSISRIEKLFSLSEELGIDMSKAGRDIFEARGALGQNKAIGAKRHIARAEHDAREAIVNKFPSIMRDIKSALKELESVGASSAACRQLAELAKSQLRKESYEEALRSLRDARRAIHNSQREVILRIMMDSKGRFVKAKKAGLDVDEAVRLVNRSRDLLRQGDFPKAVRAARESTTLINSLLEKHREARYPLLECMKAVKLAEALGADSAELSGMLAEARRYFKQNDLERSAECSRKLIEVAKASAYGKAAESYGLAERALQLAKNAGVEAAEAQEKLNKAHEYLGKDDLAKSASFSSASMLESNSAIVQALADKMKSIGEFSKGIEGEVESLTEVREAIESSKDRNLENLKKNAKIAEEIVGQAYESAAAYTRVSQDIVREAYQNSIGASPLGEPGKKELSPELSANPVVSIEDKRQRIINMYMAGKITEIQLDRLLLMIDASVAKDNLV